MEWLQDKPPWSLAAPPNVSPPGRIRTTHRLICTHGRVCVHPAECVDMGRVCVAGAVASGSRSKAAATSKDALEGDISRLETALSDALAIKGQSGAIEVSPAMHTREATMSRVHATHPSGGEREEKWGRAPTPEADDERSDNAQHIDKESERRGASARMMANPEQRQSQKETAEVIMGHGVEVRDPSLTIMDPSLNGAVDDTAAVSPSSFSIEDSREGGGGSSVKRLKRSQRASGDRIRSEVRLCCADRVSLSTNFDRNTETAMFALRSEPDSADQTAGGSRVGEA